MEGRQMISLLEGNERTYELLRRSTESINRSLELLSRDLPFFMRRVDGPICERCRATMSWSRSSLNVAERALTNVFTCNFCGTAAETTTKAKGWLSSSTGDGDQEV
jgi:hypothetical protein